jgi:hypothetical protein
MPHSFSGDFQSRGSGKISTYGAPAMSINWNDPIGGGGLGSYGSHGGHAGASVYPMIYGIYLGSSRAVDQLRIGMHGNSWGHFVLEGSNNADVTIKPRLIYTSRNPPAGQAAVYSRGPGTATFTEPASGFVSQGTIWYPYAEGTHLGDYGVWESNVNASQCIRTYTVNFPQTGWYTFKAAWDDGGNITLDGTVILQSGTFTYTPGVLTGASTADGYNGITVSKYITAGNHSVGQNGFGNDRTNGIALTIFLDSGFETTGTWTALPWIAAGSTFNKQNMGGHDSGFTEGSIVVNRYNNDTEYLYYRIRIFDNARPNQAVGTINVDGGAAAYGWSLDRVNPDANALTKAYASGCIGNGQNGGNHLYDGGGGGGGGGGAQGGSGGNFAYQGTDLGGYGGGSGRSTGDKILGSGAAGGSSGTFTTTTTNYVNVIQVETSTEVPAPGIIFSTRGILDEVPGGFPYANNNYSDWQSDNGIWNYYPDYPNFHFGKVINFPTSGNYLFQFGSDNIGYMVLDGNVVIDLRGEEENFRSAPREVVGYVGSGLHTVEIHAENFHSVGSIAAIVTGLDSNVITTTQNQNVHTSDIKTGGTPGTAGANGIAKITFDAEVDSKGVWKKTLTGWKRVSNVYVKNAGTWKNCSQVYTKVDGVWKPTLGLSEPNIDWTWVAGGPYSVGGEIDFTDNYVRPVPPPPLEPIPYVEPYVAPVIVYPPPPVVIYPPPVECGPVNYSSIVGFPAPGGAQPETARGYLYHPVNDTPQIRYDGYLPILRSYRPDNGTASPTGNLAFRGRNVTREGIATMGIHPDCFDQIPIYDNLDQVIDWHFSGFFDHRVSFGVYTWPQRDGALAYNEVWHSMQVEYDEGAGGRQWVDIAGSIRLGNLPGPWSNGVFDTADINAMLFVMSINDIPGGMHQVQVWTSLRQGEPPSPYYGD